MLLTITTLMIFQAMTTRKYFGKRRCSSLAFILYSKILYIILLIHFIIIGFNQFPDNPVKHKFKKELINYTNPFFTQTWKLFSPNPVNTNMNLLIQFKYTHKGKENTSDWMDISEPLFSSRQNNFWSASQRISKFLTSCMQSIQENQANLAKEIKNNDTLSKLTDSQVIELYKKSTSSTYGHQSILQYSECVARIYFSKKNIIPSSIEVKYKIYSAKFPRFSKREEDYYNFKNYTFSHIVTDFQKIK